MTLLLACGLASAFSLFPVAKPLDVAHAEQFADRSIYPWSYPTVPSEVRRVTFRDLWAACRELCGGRALPVFRLLVALGWQENGLVFGVGDSGDSWGPWQLQDYEVEAAAKRLGKLQAGSWTRFRHDRTFCVWISVEHYRWLLQRHGWQPRRAAMAHYAGAGRMDDWRKVRAYLPITIWYYDLLWEVHLPKVLLPDVPSR